MDTTDIRSLSLLSSQKERKSCKGTKFGPNMRMYNNPEQARTVTRLTNRKEYPVPEEGDIIIYNEIPRYYDHSGFPERPKRGIAKVQKYYKRGGTFHLLRLAQNGCFFSISISYTDFANGLYEFLLIRELPEECPEFDELNIKKLDKNLRALVYHPSDKRTMRES